MYRNMSRIRTDDMCLLSRDGKGDVFDNDPCNELIATLDSSVSPEDNTESNRRMDLSSSSSPIKPIFVDKGQSWELTWPIWHMLPRSERKYIAIQHGYNTIGDFEEHMSLTRALGHETADTLSVGTTSMYEDDFIRGNLQETSAERTLKHKRTTQVDELEESTIFVSQEVSPHVVDTSDPIESIMDDEESFLKAQHKAFLNGGRILILPDEILIYRILAYLDVDYFASCALVSPHWKTFTRTEAVYKEICERCYLQQSKRKELHVSRFGNSYRNMLYMRPRLKTGCGLYVLKFSQIKKIQRDMWTEIPIGAVLETTYYRYAYFQEDGKVLYALSPLHPQEMIPKFAKIRKEGTIVDNKCGIVWGTYQVQKFCVNIYVSHPWHDVKLELKILENGCDEVTGRFWAMSLERHFSSASGDFDEYWSRDLVEYSVPHQPFIFLRDWRL